MALELYRHSLIIVFSVKCTLMRAKIHNVNPHKCPISKVNECRCLGLKQLLNALGVENTCKNAEDCGEEEVYILFKGRGMTSIWLVVARLSDYLREVRIQCVSKVSQLSK